MYSKREDFTMKRVLLIIYILSGLFSIKRSAYAEGAWEYWSHFEVVGSINNKLDFKVKPELRYNTDFTNHYYTHFEIGLDWKIRDWFISSPYYRHINKKKVDNWKVESRSHLNATFKLKIFWFSFTSRNRLEYRIKKDDDLFRYRNMLTIKLPKFTPFKVQPYIAEEFFYDFCEYKLNKNRIYSGIDFKVFSNLRAGTYYILESLKKKGDWTNINVLGTTLKYNF